MSSTIATPAAAAPEPDDRDGVVVDMTKRIPTQPAPAAVQSAPVVEDEPSLIPEWMKSREGRRAARRRMARQARNAQRRWARQQKTERGHVAQAARGMRRTHEWVIGVEGVRVQAAKHTAHAANKDAKQAARRARWAIADRQAAAQHSDRASTVAHAAVQAHKAARREVTMHRFLRAAAAYVLPAAGDAAAYVEAGWPAALGGAALWFGSLAFAGRHRLTGETFTADDKRFGDGDGLSDSVLTRAFIAAKIITDGQRLTLRSPIIAVGEHAYQAVIDLPDGVTYDKVRGKEAELAGALGVTRDQLDLRKAGAEGRVSLWASMVDPFDRTMRSPLMDARSVLNSWQAGIPVGFDARGQLVSITISDYSLLLGGITRSGKGMGTANILAGALLDPRVNVRLFDGKGTGEYVPMAPALVTFVRRDPARLLATLRLLMEEMNRRSEILVQHGLSKLTEKLLDELGGIELLVVDELASYTAAKGPSKEYAEEITELLAQIASMGAALGIVLVLITQYPEVAIVPSRLRGNCGGRWAMRCENADGSNSILGNGKAGDGYNAADLPAARGARGRGWLITPDHDRPQMIRSLFIDEQAGEIRNVIAIATELRRAAKRLPGQWADPVEAALLRETGASSAAGGVTGNGGIVRGTVLDHLVRAAEATGRGNVSNTEALTALAAVDADRYGRATDEADAAWLARTGKVLKASIAALGVEVEASRVLLEDGSRPGGYTLAALQAAAAQARK